MTRTIYIALVGLGILGMNVGNAKDNQGMNDYAKAYWNPSKSCVPFVRKYESVCGANFSTDPGSDKGFDDRTRTNACSGLSIDQRPTVQKGQNISIYLNQAFIHDFTERWEGLFGSKKGEIAVVARVAELDERNDLDFTKVGQEKGRLVYYSEGVRPGQFLNFSQLPIYGPIEYTGRPLVMEFYIIELDVKESTEVSGLLSAAAGLGSMAYPPASPILKVLDTIGGGLLKTNKNDLEFKYHTALLAGDMQISSLKTGTLEYGNYVFVRIPFPEKGVAATSLPHRWNKWWFNQKNGRLYSEDSCNTPVADLTYFSLQINRSKETATLDSANTFAQFMTKLTAEANTALTEKLKVVEALKKNVEEEKAYRDAKKLIDHANSLRWLTGGGATPQNLDAPTRAALVKLAGAVDTAVKIARKETPGTPVFDEERAYTLVDAFGRLIGAKKLAPQSFDATDVMTQIP